MSSLKGKARVRANIKARNRAKNFSSIRRKNFVSQIKKWEDPVLKKTCSPVDFSNESEKEEVLDIVQEMEDVLRATKNGVGISASQIGYSKRIIMFFSNGDRDKVQVCINPSIIEKSEETQINKEGCLSYPDFYFPIVRPQKLKVMFEDIDGKEQTVEYEGFEAAVVGHEYDHTVGVCLVGEAWKQERDNEIERRKNRRRHRVR